MLKRVLNLQSVGNAHRNLALLRAETVLTAICTISFLCQQMENSCKEDFEPNIVKHVAHRHGEFVTPICINQALRIGINLVWGHVQMTSA